MSQDKYVPIPYTVPDDGSIWAWGWNEIMPDFAKDVLNFNQGLIHDYGNYMEKSISSVLRPVADVLSGETAKNQNMELQDAANKFTTSEREAAEKYNAEQALLARDHQEKLQLLAQQFNHDEAELNRQWQEQMSNTSYQRAVADMKEAGMNPFLAYAQGGAPMSSSQSASVGVANSPSASVNAGQGKTTSVSSTAGAVIGLITSIASTALGVANLFGGVKSATKPVIGFR